MRRTLLGIAALTGFVFMGCSLLDSAEEAANIVNVKFSDAGWTDTVTTKGKSAVSIGGDYLGYKYRGVSSPLDSILKYDVFLRFSYNVRADNSGNSGTAAFGSDLVKPELNLYIQDTTNSPIKVTVDPFTIPGGAIDTVTFAFDIPFETIYKSSPSLVKTILNGNSIPYKLTASLSFQVNLPDGSTLGTSTSELHILSSSIPTRPSGDIVTAILSYL